MTVQTTEIIAGPFNGNGIVDEFPYEFTLTDSSYVLVYETDDDGVTTQLTLGDDYTVSGIEDPEGGEITRVAGPLPTGYVWYMRTNYPYTQLTAFASQGSFFPQVHEQAFDHLTYLVLQLFDYVKRAPTLPIYYPIDDDDPLQLPLPEPGKYLMWNDDNQLVNASISIEGDVNFEEITTEILNAVTANIEELVTNFLNSLGIVSGTQFQGEAITLEIVGGEVICDLSLGSAYYLELDQNITAIKFTNMPTIRLPTLQIDIENTGSFTVGSFEPVEMGWRINIPETVTAAQPAANTTTCYGLAIMPNNTLDMFPVPMKQVHP